MKDSPISYDDWLKLSPEERNRIHHEVWNTYERDGIGIAYMAGARLAQSCDRRVVDVQIGTYHGGEYLLHMMVAAEDFADCPPMLEDEFEGFRVVWMPMRDFEPMEGGEATLEGIWVSEDGYYEFNFESSAAGVIATGKAGNKSVEMNVEWPTINGQHLLLSAYDQERDEHTQHTFRLVAADVAEDDITKPVRFNRK